MSDHLLIATRKGLFALERKRAGWDSRFIGFEGVAVTNVLRTDGMIYAALKHVISAPSSIARMTTARRGAS